MNWGHYNQALAHPLGANFSEIVQILGYYRGRSYAEVQFNYSWRGLDRDGENLGSDIYQSYETRESDYGNKMLQGVSSRVYFISMSYSFLLNPSWNTYLEAEIQFRNQEIDEGVQSGFYGNSNYSWLALKTRLFNQHFDR